MKKLIICCLMLTACGMFAATPLTFNDAGRIFPLGGPNIEVAEDPTGKLGAEEMIHSSAFHNSKQAVTNFGVSKSSFWMRFEIKNATDEPHLLLKLSYPNIDEVEFFTVTASGGLTTDRLGKDRPYSYRHYNHPSYIFDLIIPQGQSLVCYMKIRGGGQLMAPLYLGTEKTILQSNAWEDLITGIYAGIIFVMFFYNLFVYFSVKDKVYLYYVGYIIIVGLVQLCLLGYTFRYLWPNSTWLASHSVYLLSALVGITSIEFIKVFLQTKVYTPNLHKGFHVLSAIYIAYIVLDFFDLSDEAYNIIQLCAMILSFYMFFVAYRIMKKGYHPAKFFLLAWSSFLVGVFIYALKDVGVLPYNEFTIYTMPVGSALEATLLSFALADKINALRKEKEDSNAKALELLTENERIVREQNVLLETKVQERTAELEASNKSLKEAEAHLINVEKMASLGQLTAGISHEINNPINFVSSNIKPLKRDVGDILQILSKYSEIRNEEGLPEKLKEIGDLKKRLDLDYLIEEIDLLLKGIDEGASRTSEIVKGLKNFSRNDEADVRTCDVHHEMDATLALLNNGIQKGKIQLIREYGPLPPIQCYPGKLNQVFMNIFNNAIQAIETSNLPEGSGIIRIQTSINRDQITIKVSDNGVGIPKKNVTKIFEPFFSTKPVGMGTGLGLSIVYGIIKSHKGEIKIESDEGKGAEFIITLPIQLSR